VSPRLTDAHGSCVEAAYRPSTSPRRQAAVLERAQRGLRHQVDGRPARPDLPEPDSAAPAIRDHPPQPRDDPARRVSHHGAVTK